MIVSLHIFIAIVSLLLVTRTFFKTTNKTLLASYVSIFATLASGLYLVVTAPAQMLHTCEAGLVYLAVTLVVTHMARVRLAVKKEETSL